MKKIDYTKEFRKFKSMRDEKKKEYFNSLDKDDKEFEYINKNTYKMYYAYMKKVVDVEDTILRLRDMRAELFYTDEENIYTIFIENEKCILNLITLEITFGNTGLTYPHTKKGVYNKVKCSPEESLF